MLASRQKSKIFLRIVAIGSLGLLSACNNGEALESLVNADPQLRAAVNQNNSINNPTLSKSQDGENTASSQVSRENTEEVTSETTTNPIVKQPVIKQPLGSKTSLSQTIPSEIPLYPQAELLQIEPESTSEKGTAFLRSPDKIIEIADYYQKALEDQSWEIIQPFQLDNDGVNQSAIANKDNLKIKISLTESSVNTEESFSGTTMTIAYQPFTDEIATSPTPIKSTTQPKTTTPKPQPQLDSEVNAAGYFSDLGEVPEQLQQVVKQVAAIGILTPQTKDTTADLNKFAPNEPITRRDYARWLVSANNKYYENSPGKKIHLVSKTNQVAFQDIDLNDPDFAEIQGLAEAGLIPSMLTNDANNVLFKPDAPLTREDLLTWKVPLDLRTALPKASIQSIEETWGFQDTAKISPQAVRALFADFQNGDQANVRRIFGYTTLLQPKKPVTRAEAAASLWYFGFQGDGVTAEEVFALINSG